MRDRRPSHDFLSIHSKSIRSIDLRSKLGKSRKSKGILSKKMKSRPGSRNSESRGRRDSILSINSNTSKAAGIPMSVKSSKSKAKKKKNRILGSVKHKKFMRTANSSNTNFRNMF